MAAAAAAVADDPYEVNYQPFFVDRKRQRAAWKRIEKWVPVNGNLYPAAGRWWREQKETQLTQDVTQRSEGQPQRDFFVRSHPHCKYYYMDEAMKFLHKEFLDVAGVETMQPDVCQYIFEIAMQMFILFEERKFDKNDIFAIFARALQISWRQTAMELGDAGEFDHPDYRFWTPEQLDTWWKDRESMPLRPFLAFISEHPSLAAVHGMFRKHVDTVALDHMYLLRACLGDPHVLWQITRHTDDADLPSIRCSLTFVGPFYIVTEELDDISENGAREKAVLYPMSTHVWSGYARHRDGHFRSVLSTIELRMDDGGYNSSMVRVFDARFPSRAPRAPAAAAADAQDMDEEAEENDVNIEDEDPL